MNEWSFPPAWLPKEEEPATRIAPDAPSGAPPEGGAPSPPPPIRLTAAAPRGEPPRPHRAFLFLQGPLSPFFQEVAEGLAALGHAVHRINLCLGDRLFWRLPGAAEFHGRPDSWPGFLDRFLLLHGITDLVLLGEQRPLHRAAIAVAKRRDVAVTVTDFGYLRPDWIVLERDGMGAESRFPRDPDAIRRLAASCPEPDLTPRYADDFPRQAAWDFAFHMANLAPWPFRHHRRWLRHHPIPNHLGTGWKLWRRPAHTRAAAASLEAARAAGGPVFLFAMQMETDYSIRAYSDFPDMDSALARAIGSFARHAPEDAVLLAKVHPLDPGLKAWGRRIRRMARAAGVAGRVRFLDGALPMDPAILASRGVVTVNSTVGVRSIMLGRPTCALGRAIYDVPGLAWPGAALDRFWREAPPPDPGLAEAFVRAVAGWLQVRGVYYGQPGLEVAVRATVERLHAGTVGVPEAPAVLAAAAE
jgi:capsular polysaccharide export protein